MGIEPDFSVFADVLKEAELLEIRKDTFHYKTRPLHSISDLASRSLIAAIRVGDFPKIQKFFEQRYELPEDLLVDALYEAVAYEKPDLVDCFLKKAIAAKLPIAPQIRVCSTLFDVAIEGNSTEIVDLLAPYFSRKVANHTGHGQLLEYASENNKRHLVEHYRVNPGFCNLEYISRKLNDRYNEITYKELNDRYNEIILEMIQKGDLAKLKKFTLTPGQARLHLMILCENNGKNSLFKPDIVIHLASLVTDPTGTNPSILRTLYDLEDKSILPKVLPHWPRRLSRFHLATYNVISSACRDGDANLLKQLLIYSRVCRFKENYDDHYMNLFLNILQPYYDITIIEKLLSSIRIKSPELRRVFIDRLEVLEKSFEDWGAKPEILSLLKQCREEQIKIMEQEPTEIRKKEKELNLFLGTGLAATATYSFIMYSQYKGRHSPSEPTAKKPPASNASSTTLSRRGFCTMPMRPRVNSMIPGVLRLLGK